MSPRARSQGALSELREQTRPPMAPLFWFTSSVGRPDKRCFIFVEGKTDNKFYKPFIHNKLGCAKEEVEIIFGSGGDGGKTSVISAAEKIEAMHTSYGKEAVYIVDRDYDDAMKRREHKVMENITVLPCYSFENYAFKPDENLKQVFRDAFGGNLWEMRYAEFQEVLEEFTRGVIPYCAWKWLCVEKPAVAASLAYHQGGEDRVESMLSRAKFRLPYSFPSQARAFVRGAIAELRLDHPAVYREVQERMEVLRADDGYIKGKLLFTLLTQYLASYGVYGRKQNAVKDKLYTLGPRFKVSLKPIRNKI